MLADPAHGAQRHHDRFSVKVDSLEEAAVLVARGFPIRMTDGQSPASLISPDRLTLEDVDDADPASLYAETSARPPFEKQAMMHELRRALLVQANQIAHVGQPEHAVAFIGFETGNMSYPYVEDDPLRIDLRRFAATAYLGTAYDYAFQIDRHSLFDEAVAQDVAEFVKGANPAASDGGSSPLADPSSLCRAAADTATGRWKLEHGSDLTVRELALLAQMTEAAVRNSLSKERIVIEKLCVKNEICLGWLRQRRDFVPTRSAEAQQENQASWFRQLLDHSDFASAFREIAETKGVTLKALAAKAKVPAVFVAALSSGRPEIDVNKLRRVGIALDLDVAHFAAAAIKAAVRSPAE